jgi:TM2 domain-containing membrane protein YozV
MRGRILDFYIQESNGVILSDDGSRYDFSTTQWKSNKAPAINQVVDFTINGYDAEEIYLLEDAEETKSRIVAGILALFLGGFGIHKFYLGCTTAGIIMLVMFLFGFIVIGIPSFIIAVIALIEALIYFFKSDDAFEEAYVNNKKCWF